jgi:hypothetical protein
MERVAVFIDYDYAHRRGHGHFGGVGESKYATVIDPLGHPHLPDERLLGQALAGWRVCQVGAWSLCAIRQAPLRGGAPDAIQV